MRLDAALFGSESMEESGVAEPLDSCEERQLHGGAAHYRRLHFKALQTVEKLRARGQSASLRRIDS
jgi:hypothetical protein